MAMNLSKFECLFRFNSSLLIWEMVPKIGMDMNTVSCERFVVMVLWKSCRKYCYSLCCYRKEYKVGWNRSRGDIGVLYFDS